MTQEKISRFQGRLNSHSFEVTTGRFILASMHNKQLQKNRKERRKIDRQTEKRKKERKKKEGKKERRKERKKKDRKKETNKQRERASYQTTKIPQVKQQQ